MKQHYCDDYHLKYVDKHVFLFEHLILFIYLPLRKVHSLLYIVIYSLEKRLKSHLKSFIRTHYFFLWSILELLVISTLRNTATQHSLLIMSSDISFFFK